jgi:hypothetical protein
MRGQRPEQKSYSLRGRLLLQNRGSSFPFLMAPPGVAILLGLPSAFIVHHWNSTCSPCQKSPQGLRESGSQATVLQLLRSAREIRQEKRHKTSTTGSMHPKDDRKGSRRLCESWLAALYNRDACEQATLSLKNPACLARMIASALTPGSRRIPRLDRILGCRRFTTACGLSARGSPWERQGPESFASGHSRPTICYRLAG